MNSDGSGDIISSYKGINYSYDDQSESSSSTPVINRSLLTVNRVQSLFHATPLQLKRKPALTNLTRSDNQEYNAQINLLLQPQDGFQLQRKLTGIGDFQSPQVSHIIQAHELQAKGSGGSDVVCLRRQGGCIQIPQAQSPRPNDRRFFIADLLNNNGKKNEKLMYVLPVMTTTTKKNYEESISSEFVCIQRNKYMPPPHPESLVSSRIRNSSLNTTRNLVIFRDQLRVLNEDFLRKVRNQIEENPYDLLTETLQQYLTKIRNMGFGTQHN